MDSVMASEAIDPGSTPGIRTMLINRIGYYNLIPARTDLRMAEGSWLDLLFTYACSGQTCRSSLSWRYRRRKPGRADRFAMEFFPKPLDLDALVSAVRR